MAQQATSGGAKCRPNCDWVCPRIWDAVMGVAQTPAPLSYPPANLMWPRNGIAGHDTTIPTLNVRSEGKGISLTRHRIYL